MATEGGGIRCSGPRDRHADDVRWGRGGPDAAPPPTSRFDAHYVRPDGSPSGEVDLQQANQLMESGQLNGNTFVWADGMEEWAKLCDCKALFVVNLDNMKLHYETNASLPSDVVTVREVRKSLHKRHTRRHAVGGGWMGAAGGVPQLLRDRTRSHTARQADRFAEWRRARDPASPGCGAAMAPALAPALPGAHRGSSHQRQGSRSGGSGSPDAQIWTD